MRIPWSLGTYESRSGPWANQRLVNWYVEAAPRSAQAKSPVALLPRPPCLPFIAFPRGPVRGLHEFQGKLIAVADNRCYRVEPDGSDYTFLGIVGGSGPVIMDETDIELTISTGAQAYVVDETGIQQITDAGFMGSAAVTMLDNYFAHTVPNSRNVQVSGLRDGLTFDATEFQAKESSGDNVVRAYAQDRDLWVMGEKTTEFWRNFGGVDFPFERLGGSFLERGLGARHSIAEVGGKLIFLGDDNVFYMASGYTPQPISPPGIVKKVEDDGTDRMSAWAYEQDGHGFYVVTRPWRWTLVYDTQTGFWHERETAEYGFWDAWVGRAAFGKVLAGSFLSGWIYQLRPDQTQMIEVMPRG